MNGMRFKMWCIPSEVLVENIDGSLSGELLGLNASSSTFLAANNYIQNVNFKEMLTKSQKRLHNCSLAKFNWYFSEYLK